ncbi:MAG: transposase [Candidatus Poribacteria bacterium]|nr:transposase [Candidatus Poribacteria bacterium]
MAKRKRFIAEFKTSVVLEALGNESSQTEVCRRHNLSEDQLSKRKH